MKPEENLSPPSLPNGSGAAALLAAGTGTFVLATLAIATDKIAALKGPMALYKPTGPLSGVTTWAVVIWLLVWAILDRRWRKRDVPLRPAIMAALVLLGISLLLTFPPIADLF
jgi:hypothetical protein